MLMCQRSVIIYIAPIRDYCFWHGIYFSHISSNTLLANLDVTQLTRDIQKRRVADCSHPSSETDALYISGQNHTRAIPRRANKLFHLKEITKSLCDLSTSQNLSKISISSSFPLMFHPDLIPSASSI